MQKRHRIHRDTLIENVSKQLHDLVRKYPHEAVNLRKIFQSELFGLAMKQVSFSNSVSLLICGFGNSFNLLNYLKLLTLFAGFGKGYRVYLCGGTRCHIAKRGRTEDPST